MKLSRYNSGMDKPVNVRSGGVVYERKEFGYAKFNDGIWYSCSRIIDEAMKSNTPSCSQNIPWRGLATKPKDWQ